MGQIGKKKKKLTKGQKAHKARVHIRAWHRWVDVVFPKENPDGKTAKD